MPTFPFDPNGEIDTPCNAYCMASVARAAYASDADLGQRLIAEWQLESYRTFDVGAVQGFLARGEGFAVLAFRGSDHAQVDDWIGNADFDLVYDPHIRGGQVHAGFQRAAEAIWPQVQELVSAHRPAGAKLILTGHSLGGALAALTAARFAADGRASEIDAIFTFGQPRAGDREFANRLERDFSARLFRYVNHYDLVTRLPPRLLGYDHAGQLRYIDGDGVLHENLNLWQQLLLTLNPAGKSAREYIDELSAKLPGALADHSGERYTQRLRDLCPSATPAAPPSSPPD